MCRSFYLQYQHFKKYSIINVILSEFGGLKN
jgi:hypothetical protein